MLYKAKMNRIRKTRLFPRQVSDIGAFLFVIIMMPATYIYEVSQHVMYKNVLKVITIQIRALDKTIVYSFQVTVVVPSIFSSDSDWASYAFHMCVGAFFLLNLVGNYLGLWLTDTSTRFIVLPSVIKVEKPFSTSRERKIWRSGINVSVLPR